MIRNMICVLCPNGCNLTVDFDGTEIRSLKGNICNNGEKYAFTECTHPARTLTTTVKVEGDKLVSVKSEYPLPKKQIEECMAIINKMSIKPPVRIKDVILKNIGETGINIVATKNVG